MRGWMRVLLLFVVTGCAAAPPMASGDPPVSVPVLTTVAPDAPVDAVLDALDARGQTLRDFTAVVRLAEADNATGNETLRTGRIWLQKLDGGDARMRLLLDQKQVSGKMVEDKLEYLYAGGWLVDRDYRKKINVRRQVVRPGEKVDLLKLGAGPLPLPLGQKKEDVHAQFEVKKIAAAPADPEKTFHLQLTPKPGTRYAKKLDAIDFWINAEAMPVRVQTAEGDQTRTWDLSDIRVNTDLKDSDFVLPAVNEGEWQLHEQPFEER